MSPEQARGKVDDVDHRTDIFALGVIVYQCLSGTVPFDAPTPLGVLYAVCNDEPQLLSEQVPGVSPVVDVVLGRALAKRRDDRFQSAGEFIEELGEALEATEQVSPAYVRHSSQPARQSLSQRAAATRQQARASGRTSDSPSKTTEPPLPLEITPPPEPAIEPNPRFSDASITKPQPRVSAGEVVVDGDVDMLPPGAPPVPVAALSADQTPVPSVVIDRGLEPRRSGRSASGEISARPSSTPGTSIHELKTDNFGVVAPGPKMETGSSIHEMVTGEALALPPVDADDVIRPSPDQATAETMPAPGGPMPRDRVIAIVVFTVIMAAIGVVVALLTIHA
jgi:serine/threonine-protein kinase